MGALIDKDDEPPRKRGRAPSKEQIESIKDAAVLRQLHSDLEIAIAKIEVDLDYEIGDDSWDHRARNALAQYRIAKTRVEKQLRCVDRNFEPHPQTAWDEKAREVKRVKAEAEKLAAMTSISFRGCFYDAAKRLLPQETFHAICEEAHRLSDERASVGAVANA